MGAENERLLWPDAAKGLCIFLVVLVHVTTKQFTAMDWSVPAVVEMGWVGVSQVLTPIRMPLFFAISGYFVAKYVSRSWRSVVRPRVAAVYYLYLVWFTIHTLFYSLNFPVEIHRATDWGQFALGLIFGFTSLWYLYALPVYFLVVKLCARWPTRTLIVAVVVSLCASTNPLQLMGNSSSLFENFVFFAGAALLPGIIDGLKVRTTATRALTYCFGFLLSSTVVVLASMLGDESSFLWAVALSASGFLVSVLGIAAGVHVFVWLSGSATWAAELCSFVGRRTLSIYVLHIPVIAVMNLLLDGTALPTVTLAIYPVFASIFVVALCLAAEGLLRSIGLTWLFQMPDCVGKGPSMWPGKVLCRVKPPGQKRRTQSALRGHLESD